MALFRTLRSNIFLFLLGFLFSFNLYGQVEEGEKLFKQNCASCHLMSSARLVGPGLEGVTDKYEKEWLISWIRNSQALIASGDERAIEVFEAYNKSVMTSFDFSDVSSEKVKFFTINQWFDKTFFSENAMQNLHFTSVNLKNIKKFRKKFLKTYNEDVNEVSILAYDALGLIYYCWSSNNKEFKTAQLYNKEGFKGLHAEFYIDENLSKQKLKIYKILNKKFVEVY